ncbi:MAG: enoyl-CoA hydratase/isomerase family protein [Bacteroidales bacterium]|nr:enoyl-CoA hydratase/isomerase family protein [Bacteroidales bacterium]
MNYTTISLESNKSIFTLSLINEKKLNSLSQLFFDEFDDAISTIQNDNQARVLIIKGNEKVFSAGGDLKEIGAADYEKSFLMCTRVQRSFGLLHNLSIPVIAALDGIVYGGGFELALHCDIRFCTPETILRLPESDLGLIPGAGGISLFSKFISHSDAAFYLFTGDQIPIHDALSKGIVQKVISKEEIYKETLRFATELCKRSSESLSAIKKILYTNLYNDLNEGLTLESQEFTSVLQKAGRTKIDEFFKNKINKK